MISITTVSLNQARHYYSSDNYYSKSDGFWQGKGAELLGFTGEVSKEAFQYGLEGRDNDGHQLVEVSKANKGEHRAGIDLTFSAPKSVSLLSLVIGYEKAREAHEKAVSSTLDYLERNFSQARLTKDGLTEKVDTGNLIIAKFDHQTSRELDPQLHTHCVIMNMTRRKDGQWRALSNEEIYNHKMFLGQIYRNELALNLRGLGYAIESDNKGLFEVQGIEQRLLDHFSRRSTQIDEKVKELKEGGLYTQAGDQKLREIAALGSRAAKQNPDMELVRQSWESRLREQNYTKEGILQTIKEANEKTRMAELKRTEPGKNSYNYIRLATQAKTEQESVFTKEEILNSAAKLAMGEKRIDDLEKAFRELARTRAIITLDKEKGLYTTREMLIIERSVVNRVKSGHGQLKFIMKSEEEAAKVISEKYDHLTQGQKDAAVHILSSRDRVIGIQGDAGTGKTTMLKAAGEELEFHGYRVIGLSYTGKAAAEIESNSGIKSQTLHSFLGALKSEDITPGLNSDHKGEVWVVDEASMLGSRQIYELIRAGEKGDARIVLLGDDKQLQAVEAGKMFSKLQENGVLKTVRMTEILRQTDHEYRDIIKDLSGKKIDSAFNKLETQGRIYEISDRHERFEAIIRDYLGKERHKGAIIVTARNQDRHELNSAIRDELKLQGRLPQEEYVFTVRKSRNISPSDKLFAQAYRLDDLIIANKSGIIGRAGTEAKVVNIDTQNHTLTVQTKKQKEHLIDLKTNGLHLAAYAEKRQSFSQSDKVVVLKNDKGLKVQNGMTGEVKSVDEKGNINIRLDNGRDLRFSLNSQYNYLDHGYAITDYKSQGQTAKEVLYHADTSKNVNFNQAYVAITRGKDDCHIYTDDKAELRNQMREDQVKTSTLDYEKDAASGRDDHHQEFDKSADREIDQ